MKIVLDERGRARYREGMSTAIVLEAAGSPERLIPQNRPTPEAGPGEEIVTLTGAGVNFIDVIQRRGSYPVPPGTVLGFEGVGRTRDGRRVAFFDHLGAYADEVAVPRAKLLALPDDISDDAALLIFQGVTAEYLTSSVHPIRAGETALIYAAAGGVGLILSQFVRAAGGRAIGVVSTPEKVAVARDAGAEIVVGDGPELGAQIRQLAPDGVDVVFDANGANTWPVTLESVRRRGHVVLYGYASGNIDPIAPRLLLERGSLTLSFVSIFDFIDVPLERDRRVDRLFEAIRDGKIDVPVPTRFPLAQAAEAHALIESRKSVGKIVLVPERNGA
jgi:NADPH2:quinone reductase